MKNLIILSATFCLCFDCPETPKYTFHQPDFTEAHYYGHDSCWVVQEINTGRAYTLKQGERFEDHCDFMACTDSVTTFMSYKDKRRVDTISYHKRTTGYWTEYRNRMRTGKARVTTDSLVKVEFGEGFNEVTGEYYQVRMEYYKTNYIDDLKRKIAHDDTDY